MRTGARADTSGEGTRHTGGTDTAPPYRTQSTPRNPRGTLPRQGTRRTTSDAHAQQDAPPQPRPDSAQTTPGHAHQPPASARGRGVHPHREPPAALHKPPAHPNRQATTPATLHCRDRHTDTRTRTPGEERGQGHNTKDGGRHGGRETGRERNKLSRGGHATPACGTRRTPRDRDPQRARDQGTGPKGEQPYGQPPDPPDQTAHSDPPQHRLSEPHHVKPRPQATNQTNNPSPHGAPATHTAKPPV